MFIEIIPKISYEFAKKKNAGSFSGMVISGFQMKFWAEKELEIINCFAFLECKLTVVISAC
jgi:hypothetical protein